MKNDNYTIHLKPYQFDYLCEDLELALYCADRKCIGKDKYGKFHDLTDYDLIKILKGIQAAFKKASKI